MTLGVFQKIIKQASIQNNRKEQMFLFRDPFIMSVDLEVRVKFYKNKKKTKNLIRLEQVIVHVLYKRNTTIKIVYATIIISISNSLLVTIDIFCIVSRGI